MKTSFLLIITALFIGAESLPQISFENTTGWHVSVNKDGIFSDKETYLKISCTSNDPVQWDFEGEFGEATNMWMPQISVKDVQDFSTVTYKIIYDALFSVNVSGVIICSHVQTPSVKKELFVFVSLNSSVFLEAEQTFKAQDFYGVPCPVTNPTIPVNLIKVEDSGYEVVVEAPFNPIRGFPLKLNLNPGRYFCLAGGVKSKETLEILRYRDLQLTPWADDMNIFRDESRLFQCNSTTQKVSMEIMPKDILVERIYESKNSIIIRLPPVKYSEKLILSCYSPIAHHDWRITIIDPPTIHFDNNYGSVYCRSNSTDKFVQTLRCQDDNRCSFLSHCLDEGEKCKKDKSRLNVFHAKNNEKCKLETNPEVFPCVSMKLNHYNGIARCGIANVWKAKSFFISLELNRYFNWKEAPKSELLRLSEVPSVLYANSTTSFACEGSYYLFGRNLVYALRFADGRTKTIPNTSFEEYRNENPQGKFEYSGVRLLRLTLSTDIVGIDCYGYFANSKEFLKVSRNFETRYARAPYFATENYMQKLAFENGTSAHITCPVQGEPTPVVNWLYNDRNMNMIGLEYETSINSKGHRILEIPRISFSLLGGEYKCIARNSLGEISRQFDVQISMPNRIYPAPPRPAVS